jgi:structural maintenance of chromosome 1
MGRLIGLELHNFKSYRGTTAIGFGSANFTSIIGPNGSGKSNMMDAISFVLGVRSSHLRSNQLKDLIYRGRIAGGSEGDESDDYNESSDPERAYVMALYEKSDGEILQLKRTIGASGQSEYRINNKVISAGEYSNILKTENILIKARNFLVFQGDVEQIASQSSADLTKLLETVSGSSDFAKEYEKLKEEQDRSKGETALIISRRRTFMSEFKQYREQRQEADLFKKKLAEKHDLVQLSILWKLYHINLKREKSSATVNETQKESARLKNQISEKESSFKTHKTLHAKESLKLNKMHKLISNKRSEIKISNQDLLPIEAKREVTSKKISHLKKRISDLNSDIEKQQESIKSVENQVKVVSKTKSTAAKELNKIHDVSNISIEDQLEYESLKQLFLSNKSSQTEDKKLNLLLNSRREIEAILNGLEFKQNTSRLRIEELEAQQYDLKNQLTTVSAELNQSNEISNNKKNQVKQLNKKVEDFLTKEFEISTKLKDVLINLDELNANQRETNRERKLRENVNSLRRLFPGVIGLVSDLCKPKQKKYEVAVSTILGKNFDSIIVENSVVAHQCISYLKEQRSGIASFIPLDTIEAKQVDSKLRHLDPGARPSIDVVDYAPYLEKAILYSCGNSVVCDSLELAKDIRWNKRIDVKAVTLDGSLIHKAGLMTGGRSQNQERRWNKTDVSRLTKLSDELSFQLNELQLSRPDSITIKNIENEILDLESKISSIRRKRSELENLILSNDSEIKYLVQNDESLKRQSAETKKLKEVNDAIVKQERVISELQESIFKDFCSRLGFKNIKEYETSSGSQLREQSRELKQYDNEILKLTKKLEFERERLEETTTRVERVRDELENNEVALKKLSKDIDSIKDKIDLLESELEVSIEDLKENEKQLDSKLSETKKIEDELNDLLAQKDDLFKRVELVKEDLEKYDVEKLTILKNCKIENITLPIDEDSEYDLDSISISDEISAGEEGNHIIEVINNIKLDFSSLNSRYKQNNNEIISKEFDERISIISKELASLSPNVKAIERLNEVEKKLEDLERELNVKRSEELNVVKQFQEIKAKRYELFMNAFNHISFKIDPIYKELTKTNHLSTLGGGSAYLTLEDEDEPYLAGIRYHAMPPMKRFKDMEFLSGGEKTIAALALLFAIHSFNPSPFFVLDEVDAALDNSNVNKIANYITKHASPDFQFIVISLKNGLFEKSDALVGIYREQEENSSRTLTLDLRNYPDVAV